MAGAEVKRRVSPTSLEFKPEHSELNPLKFYKLLLPFKDTKKVENDYWASRKPLGPSSKTYYLEEGIKAGLFKLVRNLVETQGSPVTSKLFDLLSSLGKSSRAQLSTYLVDKAPEEIISELLWSEDKHVRLAVILRVKSKGSRQHKRSLLDNSYDNLQFVVQFDNPDLLNFFLPGVTPDEAYEIYKQARDKRAKNATRILLEKDPSFAERVLVSELKKGKIYEQVGPLLLFLQEDLKGAFSTQGAELERIPINLTRKYNPKTFDLWQNAESEFERSKYQFLVNLHIPPDCKGSVDPRAEPSDCKAQLDEVLNLLSTEKGKEEYLKVRKEAGEKRYELKGVSVQNTTELTSFADISEFSDFAVFTLQVGSLVWFFTLPEIPNLEETKENPYTKAKLPETFLRTLKEKRKLLDRYGIDPTKILPLNEVITNLSEAKRTDFSLGELVTFGMRLGEILQSTEIQKEEFDAYPQSRPAVDLMRVAFVQAFEKEKGLVGQLKEATTRDDLYEALFEYLKRNPKKKGEYSFLFANVFDRAKKGQFSTSDFYEPERPWGWWAGAGAGAGAGAEEAVWGEVWG